MKIVISCMYQSRDGRAMIPNRFKSTPKTRSIDLRTALCRRLNNRSLRDVAIAFDFTKIF